MWVENKVLDLTDQTLPKACKVEQFMKCVNIALLCLQEDPIDRPTMSNIVTMLDSEDAIVPTPNQPAWCGQIGHLSNEATGLQSIGMESTSSLEGR